MIKYIDADKLIKSVNNYQEWAKAESNPTYGYADYYKGKIDACKDIQEFITSLRQEQPEMDLEKEIEKEWETLEKDYSPSALDKSHIIVSGLVGRKQFSLIAHHFYELGKNAKK